MVLDDFFQLAKKYCKDVASAEQHGTRIVFRDIYTKALFALELDVTEPYLEMINYQGHINGGFLAQVGLGVPDVYNLNAPLMLLVEYVNGDFETLPISSPSNFKAWLLKNAPDYSFVRKNRQWWAGWVVKDPIKFNNNNVSTFTLTRKIHTM